MKNIGKSIGACLFLLLSTCFKAQVNIDFELTSVGAYNSANGVSGWTVSSQTPTSCASTSWTPGSPEFSIVATPILAAFPLTNPYILTPMGMSPLGGANIAQLNDQSASGLRTRIAQNFTVGPANTLFEYAFAGTWQDGGHLCCEQAGLTINLYDCSGNLVSYYSKNFSASGSSCTNGAPGFSVTNGCTWTNWQTEFIDLTSYLGSCVTIEVITGDCVYGTHVGTVYFDAVNSGIMLIGAAASGGSLSALPNQLNYCPGANIAQISAPAGYASYQWFGLSPNNVPIPISSLNGGNTSLVTINNPVAGSVYTVQLVSASSLTFTQVDTLQYSSVSISGAGSYPSCPMGASGSATIAASGSGAGYNYSWLGSGSPTPVSTTSVASGLLPGVYTVSVSAIGSAACGSATAAITIGTAAAGFTPLIKPYCGNIAYLSGPSNGSAFQWYNGTTSITANQGGTAAGYTVSAPVQGTTYELVYQSSQGCKDSLGFLLTQVAPGSIAVSYNKLICKGDSTGSAALALIPSSASTSSSNSYSVVAASPFYSLSIPPSSSPTFSFSNLVSSTIYSITVSDGLCIYTTTLTPLTLSNAFINLNPASATLCPGGHTTAGAVFSQAVSQAEYTYTWSPNQFLFNNIANLPATIITPSVVPVGQVTTLIYTVTSTPTVMNCPVSHTMEIVLTNFPVPTLGMIPNLCDNSPSYTISASPAGGVFTSANPNIPIDPLTGVITPSAAVPAIYSFSYSLMPGSCVPSATDFFAINPSPTIAVSGNTSLCSGASGTLLASGAAYYSWNTGSTTDNIVITPASNTSYTLIGTNATGCSTSTFIPVTVSICTGIEALNAPTLFKLYPNPTSGELFIQTGAEEITFFVYDELGSLLIKKTVKNGVHFIDLNGFARGIYFIKALSGTSQSVQKVVKDL